MVEFFRSVCAGIAQELADWTAKKNGEKEANFASCGKVIADRGPRSAARDFHRGNGVRALLSTFLPYVEKAQVKL
jgi:hypothetical protein